jgi:hypothetical protein
MTGRAARMRLELRSQPNQQLILHVDGDIVLELDTVTLGTMSRIRQNLRDELQKVRDIVGEQLLIDDWGKLTNAMRKLVQIGNILLLQLLGSSAQERGRLEKCCRDAWPGWADNSDDAPILQVEAPLEALIPFELLPLFDASPVHDIRDYVTMQRVARRFAGFAMAVHRIMPYPISQDSVLHGDPVMHMKLFHHTQLEAASSEYHMLRGATNAVMPTGPWPDKELDEERFTEVLAGYLVDPCLGFDGHHRKDPDQIHHFSCHCDTGWDSPWDYSIELAAPNGSSHQITLRELTDAFSAQYASPRARVSMPLVVLNACASSATEPDGAMSFPELFLISNKNRGFLGTEARIPDDVAAAFAIRFYRELFRGRTVSQAVRGAKIELLNDFRNPLGALYIYYGNPALQWEPFAGQEHQ